LTVVIDASVLVAAAVDSGPSGAWAEQVVAGGGLHAPELVLVETISTLEATSAYIDCMRLDIEVYAFSPVAERVWELRHSLTSYDAWYVAVAEALDAPLATLDTRLTRAAGPTCEFHLPATGPR
jgi:predicted nucleic acid-binding protein